MNCHCRPGADSALSAIYRRKYHLTSLINDNRKLRECSYRAFERRFRLPGTADETKVTAKGKNGVLIITIGKKKAAKSHLVKIEES